VTDISTTGLVAAGERLRVGSVLSKSLEIYLRNSPKCFAVGAVMGVPSLVSLVYVLRLSGAASANSGSIAFFIEMGFLLVWVLIFALSQSMMIHGVFQDIRGRNFEIGVSIARGLRRSFPVIGTSTYAFFTVMIGMFLIFVPGFIAITMLFVVIPVCVVEGLGPGASFKRSRELTKGQRWRVLAVYLAPAIVIAICNLLLMRLGVRSLGLPGFTAGSFLIAAIGGSYQAIVNIVTYHDLRAIKEGLQVEQLAAVFD
jgi:hypothetical protein